jgi:hypothetical protein
VNTITGAGLRIGTKGDSMKKLIAVLALLFAVAVYAAEKKALKATRINDWQVLVSCTNGSHPKASEISGSVVLSCEGRVE